MKDFNLTQEEIKAIEALNFAATYDGLIPMEEDIKSILKRGIEKFIPKGKRHLVRVNEDEYPVQITYRSAATAEIFFTDFTNKTNWCEGMVGEYKFSAKVFDEPSTFGVNNGRVSKISVLSKTKMIVNYDRGWDIKPSKEFKKTFEKLMEFLEASPKRFENLVQESVNNS